MSEINFKIKGISYPDWPAIHIHKSMDVVCGVYGALHFDIFQGDPKTYNIKKGDDCVIDIGGSTVLTGYVERIKLDYDQEGASLEIHGRSKTCDLVDCPYVETPNEWKNQVVLDLIKNLCSPFNISVVMDDSVTTQANQTVENFSVGEGDLVSDMIGRLVRDHSMLAMDIGDGKLTLTQENTSLSYDAIMLGGNAIRGVLETSEENRFSDYIVKGQGIGTDLKALSDYVSPYGEFEDNITSRYRPYLELSETPTTIKKCQNRAKWIGRIMAGKSNLFYYKVRNWTQTNGKVWEINKVVTVKDNFIGINKNMLIWAVDYVRDDEEGEYCGLYLIDRGVYKLSDSRIDIKSEYDR